MQMSETEELEQAVDRILRSTSAKKLIVAGPGAGKTFLFRKVLERTPGKSKSRLVLTFINELKDDLERSLSDLASVYMRWNPLLSVGLSDDFDYFPNIPTLIKRDWGLRKENKPLSSSG